MLKLLTWVFALFSSICQAPDDKYSWCSARVCEGWTAWCFVIRALFVLLSHLLGATLFFLVSSTGFYFLSITSPGKTTIGSRKKVKHPDNPASHSTSLPFFLIGSRNPSPSSLLLGWLFHRRRTWRISQRKFGILYRVSPCGVRFQDHDAFHLARRISSFNTRASCCECFVLTLSAQALAEFCKVWHARCSARGQQTRACLLIVG